MESFKKPPKELVLDFDATDDRVHGEQEKRFFHGFYGDYCFLPPCPQPGALTLS